MLFLSHQKKAYTRIISRIPCKFVTNKVKPAIIPIKIAKKMVKIMPKFNESNPRGKK